ncbi:unnamed protein product [Ambrosiozyma monospora]|uniref:Unnamed protein product n=1 Tax=Ambrosiozyma monospora TaxID=43982 RepID=A0ACB5SVP7_AMBMO|nr:unnamed protein product [Ambrosiozyma monospora]
MTPSTAITSTTKRQKTALITGCSSGIGYHAALELASKGYKVFACARRLEPMEPLKKAYPGQIITFSMDVSSIESVNKGYDFVFAELGGASSSDANTDSSSGSGSAHESPHSVPKLDVLYNNAGQPCTFPAIDISESAMQQCFEVNIHGPIRLTKRFAPLVIASQGTIVFTGSVAGVSPFPWGSMYASSKAALHQFANCLSLEMEPFNVRVLNVITGGVNTGIADTRPMPLDSVYLDSEEGRTMFAYRKNMTDSSSLMSPEKYAAAVVKKIEKHHLFKVDYYEGSYSWILPWLQFLAPRWLFFAYLRKKFMLNDGWRVLRERFVGSGVHDVLESKKLV